VNILQVNNADLGGGAYVIGWELLGEYRRLGHSSAMAVGTRLSDDPEVHELERPHRGRRYKLETTLRGMAGARASRLAPLIQLSEPRRTVTALKGHEDFDYPGTARLLSLPGPSPEIVHAHNLHGGYFDLRQLPALSAQVPFAMTLHDAWLLSGHCAHSFECERWRIGCGDCPDLAVYQALVRDGTAHNFRVKQDIYDRSRLYVATPSRWLMDKVEQSMLARGMVEGRVIPNGLDLDTFKPGDRVAARARLGVDPSVALVLFAANATRSNPFKDFRTLEIAVELLADKLDRPVEFLCVGEAGEAERFGRANVRYLPWIENPADMADWYRAADIYLHAARADTFPNTVIEALACGTPVVATAVGGIPEQVDDRRTGRLVAKQDPAALAEAAAELLRNAEALDRIGAAAAEGARSRFGKQRMAGDYVAWFEEILKR
jgi:glycosyltransferase involved in cell wall biosynthesis